MTNRRQQKKYAKKQGVQANAVQSNNDQSMTWRQRAASMAGMHFGGDRDLYTVMGYQRDITPDDYFDVYERQDIAGRIVDIYPEATWREEPIIDGDDALLASVKSIDEKFGLWQRMQRLDRLMNLGHYGVLLLGLDGGEHLDQPASGSDYGLIYLQPHSERTAKIIQWEDDATSSRYGMPKMYSITSGPNWGGAGGGNKTMNVHHSRVIHVAEGQLEHEAIGIPRLERGFNRLMDCDKLLGGSAEMYWQNVAMIMAFLADKDAQWEPEEKEDMRQQLDDMQNRLSRALRLRGVDVKNIAPGLQGASPKDHVEVQKDFICSAYAIPKRILFGNEAGEMASSQDVNAFQGRISERRQQVTTPEFVRKFLDAGLSLGFIDGSYSDITWPESDSLGEEGRAKVALAVSQAVSAYSLSPGAERMISVDEFREILGYDAADFDLPPMTEDEERAAVIQFNKSIAK